MRFYRMKTVKMQEEAAFLAPIDSSFKHASADPAFAGVDGFNGLPRAEVRDGPDGAFLAQAQNVSTMICARPGPSATILNRSHVYGKSARVDRAL
jgi:hypothetical protein